METEKPELDQEIEELNKYRRLPFPLEETDKFFYYPFKDITLPFLEEVYQKFLSNLDTHEHNEISEEDEDMDEYNQSENNDSLETYNEEEEEIKLSKRTSEMIGEDLPVLKKNRSNLSQKKKFNNSNNFTHDAPKSVKSIRSNTSKKSKTSNLKNSEDLDDLEMLPPLKLK